MGIYRRKKNSAYDRSLNVERPWPLIYRRKVLTVTVNSGTKHTLTGGAEYYKDKVLNYQDLAKKYSDGTVISKAVSAGCLAWPADSVKAVGSLRQDWNSCEQAFSCFFVGISAL